MNRIEFEKKYLLHNYFWVTGEKQATELQNILVEFGYVNPVGTTSHIKWHEGFYNLGTFQPRNHKNTKYFQKTTPYNPDYSYGKAVNYKQFIKDYLAL